jgi:hypothetical protein
MINFYLTYSSRNCHTVAQCTVHNYLVHGTQYLQYGTVQYGTHSTQLHSTQYTSSRYTVHSTQYTYGTQYLLLVHHVHSYTLHSRQCTVRCAITPVYGTPCACNGYHQWLEAKSVATATKARNTTCIVSSTLAAPGSAHAGANPDACASEAESAAAPGYQRYHIHLHFLRLRPEASPTVARPAASAAKLDGPARAAAVTVKRQLDRKY